MVLLLFVDGEYTSRKVDEVSWEFQNADFIKGTDGRSGSKLVAEPTRQHSIVVVPAEEEDEEDEEKD